MCVRLNLYSTLIGALSSSAIFPIQFLVCFHNQCVCCSPKFTILKYSVTNMYILKRSCICDYCWFVDFAVTVLQLRKFREWISYCSSVQQRPWCIKLSWLIRQFFSTHFWHISTEGLNLKLCMWRVCSRRSLPIYFLFGKISCKSIKINNLSSHTTVLQLDMLGGTTSGDI